MRIRYSYNFLPESELWTLKGSIGLSFNYVSVTLLADTGEGAEESDFIVRPFIGIYGGVKLGKEWAIAGEFDWIEITSDSFVDASLWVRW